jgi:fibronectin type 3 domain-containing protein
MDSALFFASYAEAAALNTASPILEEDKKGNIWKLAQKHNIVDSLGFYVPFPAFQQALGTAYCDTTAMAGKLYDYKISMAHPGKKPSEVLVKKVAYTPQLIPAGIKTVYAEPYETKVMLRYYTANGFVPAIIKLYRQYYLQGEFKEVPAAFGMQNQDQKKFYMLTDNEVKRGLVYNYYAVPFDHFGNPGTPSDTVRLTNLVQAGIPAVRKLKASSDEKNHAINLSWTFTPVPYLKSINVYRSESYDTTRYNLVATLSAKETMYVDRNVSPVQTYYYFVKLNGDRSSGLASARVAGMLKADRPAPAPSELQLSTANEGVRLSWNRPAAPDIRGYYLYRSENDTTNMKQVSGFIPASGRVTEHYTDTLAVKGNRKYYYTIRAENTSYAKSARSASAGIDLSNTKEDKSPVVLRAKQNGSLVMLHWPLYEAQTGSTTGYEVYRKPAADSSSAAWARLSTSTLRPDRNYFEDSTAIPGLNYRYRLEIIRKQGKTSSEVTFGLDKPKLLSPGGIVARRNGRKVTIAWDASMQDNITGYKIYKLNANGQYEVAGTVQGQTTSSFNISTTGEERVSFTVVSIDTDNEESEAASWISI